MGDGGQAGAGAGGLGGEPGAAGEGGQSGGVGGEAGGPGGAGGESVGGAGGESTGGTSTKPPSDDVVVEGGGCDCRQAGGTGRAGSVWLALALAGALVRRRRAGRASTPGADR
jgi:hypothetical protein